MTLLVNIDVPTLDAAVRFYRDGLGLTPLRRLGEGAMEMQSGATRVYLLEKPAGAAAAPGITETRRYARHWTPVHLDFVTDALEPAIARATTAGARLETAVDSHVWGRIAGLSDPWGNGFCLLEFSAAGYDAIAD